jgi:DNA repair exonuclease SbcCD ATPase subunit
MVCQPANLHDRLLTFPKAPASVPRHVKLALILKQIQKSSDVYSSAEIKKKISVWAATSSAETVLEYLTELVDEGHIRVEKIGIGNWYWSFPSEAKKNKEKVLQDLEIEQKSLSDSITELDKQIKEETATREDDPDEMILDGALDRETLLGMHKNLLREKAALERELANYSDSDPIEMQRRADETKALKESAEKWTDYIEAVESLIRKLTNDRRATAEMMEKYCGDEYAIGEGLKEL